MHPVPKVAPLIAALMFVVQLPAGAADCAGCLRAAPTAAGPQIKSKTDAGTEKLSAPARSALHPTAPVHDLKGAPLPADLRPLPFYPDPASAHLPQGFPGVLYCDPNPAGGTPNKVRFRVRNQGGTQAPASTVRVTFLNAGSVNVAAPALGPGMETSGAVDIPPACFPPGFSTACQFSIRVDALQQITESVENNNATNSMCVQPAG